MATLRSLGRHLLQGEAAPAPISAEFQAQFDAAYETASEEVVASVDTMFLLFSGFLVFFMQAGFCFLAAGSIRAKSAKSIMLKNLLDVCVGAIAFYLVGYAFAYGSGNSFIGGGGSEYKYFALSNGGLDDLASWFFQFAFAAASATIVSGAVAERATFVSYLCYSVFLTAFVYPVIVHWVWSSYGWLSAFQSSDLLFGVGAYDFAGSGVVHATGGVAALMGAWILGPRIGRFDGAGRPLPIPGHSTALAVLGVFILWLGWYGFNPGSALLIVGVNNVVERAVVNTTLAGAAAAVTALFTNMALIKWRRGVVVWDVMVAGNGALGGLVSVTANCPVVYPWAALIIGMLGGWMFLFGRWVVLYKLKIDDPVDAIAVHAFCGYLGVLLTSLFAVEGFVTEVYGEGKRYGLFFDGGGRLLAANLVYIVTHFAFVGAMMGGLFWTMNRLGMFRVSKDVEFQGADASYHGGMDGAEPLVIGKGGGKEGQHGSTGTPPEASQHGFGLDMGRRLAQADQESLLAQVRELQAKVEALEKA